ncbi:DNA-directed RNA polymerase ECF-type sigma factor (sigma-W) [Lyngbya sp. PCC 8106]|nr:DNA-directed RNA polymerase ECF-type sigma factor (sigma-W) [Lyngbya sp. PCC 8106]
MQAAINSLPNPTEEQQLLQCLSRGEINAFWQLFEQHRDYLFRCCVKWMNGNSIEAEDVLSRAIIKAWEKIKQNTVVIDNFKAWLTKLTYNLCIDIHRQHNRNTKKIESLDTVCSTQQEEWVSQEETPFLSATRRETAQFLRNAIENLPPRLREVFVLFADQELSYQEIAQHLNISYDNVRKRISQARKTLREQLQEYEGGEQSVPSLKIKKSQKEKLEKPVKTENIVSSGELEKELIIADDNSSDTASSIEHNQPIFIEKPVDEVEKKPISHSSPIQNMSVAHALRTVEIQRKFTRELSCTSAPDFKYRERATFSIVKFEWTKSLNYRRKQSLKLGRMSYAPKETPWLTLRRRIEVQNPTKFGNFRGKLCWQMWADSGGFTTLKSRISTSMGIDSS